MAKRSRARATAVLKVMAVGGQANPAPPLGPALSQAGVRINEFVTQFNSRTQDQMGVPLPVVVYVYRDGSFDFDVKKPPASYLIKQAAGIVKGSGITGRETVGRITREQLREVAEAKMIDLNAADVEGAMRILEGTARSCGIEVAD